MKMLAKRRRLEGKTNYSKRMRMLEGRKPRIIIRKSNKYILLGYVDSKSAQDAVKVSISSKDLLDYGWPAAKAGSLKSLGAAYLAGILFGKKISKLPPAILDTGLIRSTKGSRIYAAANGIVDSGFKMPCSKEVYPEENRIKKDFDFFDKVKKSVMEAK
jgi:large subunit ribosomal protein L18